MDKFLKEYHGHKFRDDGAYCSEDFKNFSNKFKSYLRRKLPECNIVNHKCGHYECSGFAKKGSSCVYYSFSWNRFSPVDVYDATFDRMNCVLYRDAKDERDYRGGRNRRTSFAELPNDIEALLDGTAF